MFCAFVRLFVRSSVVLVLFSASCVLYDFFVFPSALLLSRECKTARSVLRWFGFVMCTKFLDHRSMLTKSSFMTGVA